MPPDRPSPPKGGDPGPPEGGPRREPTTAILPDLGDLLDRRVDPHRWGERDRRALPVWAQAGPGQQDPIDGDPAEVGLPPTVRFDRGRHGFAAVIARPLGFALAMAAPAFLMGMSALVIPTFAGVVGLAGVTATMLILIATNVLGLTIARGIGQATWANVWLVLTVLTSVVIPLLGLQAILGGVPFTALGLGSGGPFLVTTLATVASLLIATVMVAAACRREPESAALVFLPIAMAVPALLGQLPEEVSSGVATVVGLTSLATAAVVLVTVLLPRGMWLLVPQAALALELVVLVATGSGPRAVETTGQVVPVAYGAVLVVTLVASVSVPLLARWLSKAAGEAPVVREWA